MKDKNDSMRGACLSCDCTEYKTNPNSSKCDACSCNASQHREQDYDSIVKRKGNYVATKELPFVSSFLFNRQVVFGAWLVVSLGVASIKLANGSIGFQYNRGDSPTVYLFGLITFFWISCFAGAATLFARTQTKRAITQAVFWLNLTVTGVYALHYTGLTLTVKDLGGYPLDIARYVEWLFDMHQLAAIIGFVTRASKKKADRAVWNAWALTLAGLFGSVVREGSWSQFWLLLSYGTHCASVTALWDMYRDAINEDTSANLSPDYLSLNQYITNYSWHAFGAVHFLARYRFITFAQGEILYYISHMFAKIPLTLMVLTAPEEDYTPVIEESTQKIKVY